jgi:hypothetical protein
MRVLFTLDVKCRTNKNGVGKLYVAENISEFGFITRITRKLSDNKYLSDVYYPHQTPHKHRNTRKLDVRGLRPGSHAFQEARWRRLQFDCAWVLDNCRDRLEDVGWTAVEVFRVDPVYPYPRLDCYGLAISLKGGRIISVTAAGARIVRPSGSVVSYQRRRRQRAFPVWNLGMRR